MAGTRTCRIYLVLLIGAEVYITHLKEHLFETLYLIERYRVYLFLEENVMPEYTSQEVGELAKGLINVQRPHIPPYFRIPHY